MGNRQWKQWLTLFFWAPKWLQMVTAAMKLKDICSLGESLWQTWKWKWLSRVLLFVTPWTGVGSLSLLKGILPTQDSNPSLPHCRYILYQLSHKGNPRILEWVAYRFSSVSSWPRNQTGVSCTASQFFTNWAIREALWQTWQTQTAY